MSNFGPFPKVFAPAADQFLEEGPRRRAGPDRTMRILVTGGAGYIGSLLCPALLDAGHDVVLLDSLMFGVQPILHFISHPRLEVVHGDIRDARVVQPLIARVDAVLHLAAIVGYPACAADPTTAETTNVEGTRVIVDALSRRSGGSGRITRGGGTSGELRWSADHRPCGPLVARRAHEHPAGTHEAKERPPVWPR